MKSSAYLLKNGRLVDPASMTVKKGSLRIANGKIAGTGANLAPLPGEQVIPLDGKLVLPGLVDTHVHIEKPYAHRMLAKAGVTTALDMLTLDKPDDFLRDSVTYGSGIHVAWLRGLVPGETLSGADPQDDEIARQIDFALANGAYGVKIVGGHRPLTRRATQAVIRLAHERKAWMAFHTGTVETNGDIRGLLEAIELAKGLPIHIAHINSYCRGGVFGALNETKMAIDALKEAPNCQCESYLSVNNGTSGHFLDENTPESRVTSNELKRAGYPPTRTGIRQAIADGVVKVNLEDAEEQAIILAPPERGLAYFDAQDSNCNVSFPANSPLSGISLALAKDAKGEFVIKSLSTDGGRIPRNVTLEKGLLLVKFGAFTLQEFALKASLNPAIMLGLTDRGALTPGMAADIVVANEDTLKADLVFSDGVLICENGKVSGQGCTFLTLPSGEAKMAAMGYPYIVTRPLWLEKNCRHPVKTIGILGGLGPLATADLFQKLVKATPARCDQEHPHTIVDNDCRIPDRTAALEKRGESPVPEMLAAARRLKNAGADFIIMPCNTAHAFLPEVQDKVKIPFLNMIEATVSRIRRDNPGIRKIGLLATSGTVKSGIYAKACKAAGMELVVPAEAGQKAVMDSIYSPEYGIKAGFRDKAAEILRAEGEKLVAAGAETVILGCTEIPLVIHAGDLSVPVADTTQVLAEEAVKRAYQD